MPVDLKASEALDLWRRVLVDSVRRAGPDLSARQLALVLTVYMSPAPHTVRSLAALLNISKPAVTRALDRLGKLGIIRRKVDENDRRSIFVKRTVKGSAFLRAFADLIAQTARALREGRGKGPGAATPAA
ncbi:MAG: MarR family transcriptional regulator [Alphaproteobacteria bacterium]|nr:MarR family transcriptional regulator [Alphaproteobacteria bacterium]